MVPEASMARLNTAALSSGLMLAGFQVLPLSSDMKGPADVPATRRPFLVVTKALTVSSLSFRATGVHWVPRFSVMGAEIAVSLFTEELSALLQKTSVAEIEINARHKKEVFSMVLYSFWFIVYGFWFVRSTIPMERRHKYITGIDQLLLCSNKFETVLFWFMVFCFWFVRSIIPIERTINIFQGIDHCYFMSKTNSREGLINSTYHTLTLNFTLH